MPTVTLARGVFTLSLDFELIWGTRDLEGLNGYRRQVELERSTIVDRLLALLVEFDISATWATVGHLFLERCDGKHADITRPRHSWVTGDWFAEDRGGCEKTEPLLFGRSLVQKIKDCPVEQEIGCHSFSHVIFGDSGCSRETAESELRASVAAARELGIEMKSFVFPRNSIGHLDALKANGFRHYRGPSPNMCFQSDSASARAVRLMNVMFGITPPVVLPERGNDGLWNVPASIPYLPMHGVRRFIPVSRRVRQAYRGLDAAAREKKVFHFWFHPTNMADGMEPMFAGLRQILGRAAELREAGRLDCLSMTQLVEHCGGHA